MPRYLASQHLRTALFASVAFAAIAGAAINTPAISPMPSAVAATIAPEQGFADLVEKVSPAVVSVLVRSEGNVGNSAFRGLEAIPEPFRRFFGPDSPFAHPDNGAPRSGAERMSQGSGFFISADGFVVTNNHVVEDAIKVTIRLDNGEELAARVVGTDRKTDLALLKVDEARQFPFVTLSGQDARVGDWVVAVGNPFGLGGTVTAGIVSARGRDIGAGPYDDFIQIDASVNRGNSGGPAFALNGSVIGVNTAIFSPSGGNVGIAFAIPASTVEQVIDQLKASGHVARGWLGVQIQPVNDAIAEGLGLSKDGGALVAQVVAGSPAEKAGLKVGDAITKLDGQALKDHRDLVRKIGAMLPDQKASLTIWRGGRTIEKTLMLSAQPDEPRLASISPGQEDQASVTDALGLVLQRNSDGVIIADVDPDSSAAEMGLRPGYVILQAGGHDVGKIADVDEAIDAAKAQRRKSVLLLIADRVDGTPRFIALPFDA